MRSLMALAAVLLLSTLSGCVAGSTDKYFPPAKDLPDGLVPFSTADPQWKAIAPALGMSGNPGRITVLGSLPQKEIGQVGSVDAYLLQDAAGKQSYTVLALAFKSGADVGATLAKDGASACDGKGMAHVLRDGLTYVFVSGDGSTASGKLVLDHLASAVQARSGATPLC